MSNKKHAHQQLDHRRLQRAPAAGSRQPGQPRDDAHAKLEIILKCDTSGCIEAVSGAMAHSAPQGVQIIIIGSGVGSVNKSDIFLAETGSRLILGFNVGIAPQADRIAAEHTVEIRLYDVIYKLLEDLKTIAQSFTNKEPAEEIIGTAEVIALFKSSRRGIILGCEVQQGKLAVGKSFRLINAMGPVYEGKIESLHVEKNAVREAGKGRQVGLKIRDFNRAGIGDLVESFQPLPGQITKPWQPQGRILYP